MLKIKIVTTFSLNQYTENQLIKFYLKLENQDLI